jgi:hypothetical protein
MDIDQGDADQVRQQVQSIVHEFLTDGGSDRTRYQTMYSGLLRELLAMPATDIFRLRKAVTFAASTGCIGFLRKAHDIGAVMGACHIIETLVIPNMDDLESGIHGIAGALHALPEQLAVNGFTLIEGREEVALAALKLECALDRNNVFGKVPALKEFVLANPNIADRMVQAIDDRKTGDLEVLKLMLDAGALADGAL